MAKGRWGGGRGGGFAQANPPREIVVTVRDLPPKIVEREKKETVHRDTYRPETPTVTTERSRYRWQKAFNGAFFEYRLFGPNGVSIRQTIEPKGTQISEIPYSLFKENGMRGLFKVYIVDPETDEIVYQGEHIAVDEGMAKMRAATKAGTLEKDLDDLDVCVLRLGNVRDREELQAQMLNRTMLSYLGKERGRPQIEPPTKA